MLDQETLNLSEYFGVLRRRRRLVIAFFVAVVATVTIGSFLSCDCGNFNRCPKSAGYGYNSRG